MVANRATHHIHRETTNRTTYPESLSRKMALSNRKLLSFGVFLLEVRTFFPKNIYCKLFFWLADVFGSKWRGCVAIKLVIQYVSYQKLHSNIEKIIFKRSFSFILYYDAPQLSVSDFERVTPICTLIIHRMVRLISEIVSNNSTVF